MAENEINIRPTLAGRVVEGVKEGIVGAAFGAAAGLAVGGAIDASGLLESNLTTEVIPENTAPVYDEAVARADELSLKATEAVKASEFASSQSEKLAANLADAKDTAAIADADEAYKAVAQAAKEAKEAADAAVLQSARASQELLQAERTADIIGEINNAASKGIPIAMDTKALLEAQNLNTLNALTDTKTLAAAGAAAGATFKGLGGLTSSQSDKRQDVENAIQSQQIQGVAQLAGMAMSEAQESKAVLGKFTQMVHNQRAHAATQGKESQVLGA